MLARRRAPSAFWRSLSARSAERAAAAAAPVRSRRVAPPARRRAFVYAEAAVPAAERTARRVSNGNTMAVRASAMKNTSVDLWPKAKSQCSKGRRAVRASKPEKHATSANAAKTSRACVRAIEAAVDAQLFSCSSSCVLRILLFTRSIDEEQCGRVVRGSTAFAKWATSTIDAPRINLTSRRRPWLWTQSDCWRESLAACKDTSMQTELSVLCPCAKFDAHHDGRLLVNLWSSGRLMQSQRAAVHFRALP